MTGPRARARWERWLPLAFAVLALVAVSPIFAEPSAFAGQYDWRYFQSWIEVGRRSVLWWHQFPLWNPYGCGGEVLLANPQSEVGAPTFLFALVFGTALGVKLVLWLYYFCAFDGMYRLARDLDLEPAGALLASSLFGAGGWLALHLASGHSNFASVGLFPYLVLAYRRGVDEGLAWSIPLGAVAAWIVALGGTSTPAFATVLLATIAITDAVARRSLRPFAVLALGAVWAAALGAYRLLPALEFATDHPRRQWETDRSTIFEMIRNGWWWRGLEPLKGKRYWFHEYGWRLAYVSPPFLAWSLAVPRVRRWWIVLLVGVGIVAGSAIPYGPWWLLKHVPIFRDLRVPSRYAVLFAFAVPILCGGALDDLVRRLRGRSPGGARALGALVVALALIDGLAYCMVHFHKAGSQSPVTFALQLTPASKGTRFYQTRSDWRYMMNEVMAGHGAIACDEEAPLERALELDTGDVEQVRLLDPAAGTVRAVRWSQNRVEADVTLERATTVLFNQNWNEHWKAESKGAPGPVKIAKVGEKWPRDVDGGRLGVEAPAGSYTVAVYYRPRSFVVGLTVTCLAIPLAVGLWLRLRRRRL